MIFVNIFDFIIDISGRVYELVYDLVGVCEKMKDLLDFLFFRKYNLLVVVIYYFYLINFEVFLKVY